MRYARVHATWDQRIGREAADLLVARARLGLIPLGFLVATAGVARVVSGSGYWLVETPLILAVLGLYLPLNARANRRLAAAMSRHLGFPVSPGSLPRLLTTRVYDGLLAEAAGEPRRTRSYLGGFVRVSLPPKRR